MRARWLWLPLLMHLVLAQAQDSSLPDHFPKYLKTGKFGQTFNQSPKEFDHAKSAKKQTYTKSSSSFTKTKTGGSSMSGGGHPMAPRGSGMGPYSRMGSHGANTGRVGSSSFEYHGGCRQQPPPPMNSMLRCSQSTGCRATCLPGYVFPTGDTQLQLVCEDAHWTAANTEWDEIPPCEPKCLPPCQNNGICFEPNRCNCPDNYSGAHCEFSKRACLNYPALPMNARRTCTSTTCTVTCLKGHEFPDGSAIANLQCVDGAWVPARAEWSAAGALPDCQATCNPPCQNDGNCLSLNVCQCPQEFRGPHCQYSVLECSPKRLGFNGGYNCSGDSDIFACSLSCPDGVPFQFPAAPQYTCQYSTGQYLPLPIPQCMFGGGGGGRSGVDITTDYYESMMLGNYSTEQRHRQAAKAHRIPTAGGDGDSGDMSEWLAKHNYMSVGSGASGQPNVMPGFYGGNFDGIKSLPDARRSDSKDPPSAQPPRQPVKQRLPTPGLCTTWGGTHHKTFDGVVFSASTACPVMLVRDRVDNTFSVVVENSAECLAPGPNTTASSSSSSSSIQGPGCHRIIHIYVQDKEYILTRGGNGVPQIIVAAMGPGKGQQRRVLPVPSTVPGMRVRMQAPHYVAVSLDTVGAKLLWDGAQLVQLHTTEALWNRTAGLCALHDGNTDNDMLAQDGRRKKTVAAHVTSWMVHPLGGEDCAAVPPVERSACHIDSLPPEVEANAEKFCRRLLYDERLQACSAFVDRMAALVDACKWDYCACAGNPQIEDPDTCACHTMDVYVAQCRNQAIPEAAIVRWRDNHTCPIRCTGGRVYRACVPQGHVQPVCGAEPQQVSLEATGVGEEYDATVEAEEGGCEEGCLCPAGSVLHGDQCVARADCPCMLRGRTFQPGDSVPKDCNTCTCLEGRWQCTTAACGARCSAVGDPHYQTFDGKRYDFMGKCSYYLVKGKGYSVEAENVACAGSISLMMNFPVNLAAGVPSCTRAVTVRTRSGHVVRLKQGREVTIDGQEVTELPHQIGGDGGDMLRAASSMFLVLELDNGMEVWWDGVTRVYLDVPASFRGHTAGLCGTFTANQADDFHTPEGDVEQAAVPFANKWKTDERCPDIKPSEQKAHPCQVQVHNKAQAEQNCAHIKADMFKKCHWLVDPEPYYQDCLYDMCSCETKVSQCLCPTVSAYAKECASRGVVVPWRLEVRVCGVHCPNGQTYQMCGNSCARSCADLNTQPNCKQQCVEGCNCPADHTLDDTGECIPVGQCPCRHDGLQFLAGYKEIRPSSLAPNLCVCINAGWQCSPASKQDLATYPKLTDRKAVCSATKHQEFTTCEPVTAATCKNMHEMLDRGTTPAVCRPGCQCRPGYVLLDVLAGGGQCVRPEACPCHHGGRSYKDGDTVRNDCNNCTCAQGKWLCTEQPCPAVCSAWGDSHFRTFDGRMYDYQGQCDYVLAKGTLANKHDDFDVTVQEVACGTLGVSCSRSLTVHVAGETVTLTHGRPVPRHDAPMRRMAVRQTDMYVFVEAADLGVVVQWDRGTRVYVRLDPRWRGHVRGLCGNYNGDQQDDFQTPSGGISEASAQLFGDSWRLQPACPAAEEVTDTCAQRPERRAWAVQQCGTLKRGEFARCHTEVPVEPFLERCVFDACACDQGGDCECLCTALAAYAQECNMRGVAVKWRSQAMCPMQCDERCATYSPCVSTCPLETCDNLLTVSRLAQLCAQESCVEGCEPRPCPTGQVYLNASAAECVPRDTCKPICMQLDGVVYSEGDAMEEDECHRCYCTRHKKVCTGQPCTVPSPTPPPLDRPEAKECRDGWSQWFNRDVPKSRAELLRGRKVDVEPLPALDEFPAHGSVPRCERPLMEEVQCRTVDGHRDPKATGLDVECSLEHGLVCQADRAKSLLCPDFELRVKCRCVKAEVSSELVEKPACDTRVPHVQHANDCSLFYHCTPTLHGDHVLVEKTCGPVMWYNPTTMICDWPFSVLQVRPDCENIMEMKSHRPKPVVPPAPAATIEPAVAVCPPGYVYSECGTECHRLCMFYTFAVGQTGLCASGAACEAGCVAATRMLSCPTDMRWRDNATCVHLADCTCRSHNGLPVKPGMIFRESECELCQCIDNHYTCDRSACTTSTTAEPTGEEQEPPPTTVVHPPTTVTPPVRCDKDRYERLLYTAGGGEWPVPDAAFTASSVRDAQAYPPANARPTSPVNENSAGAWAPRDTNKNQWVQVDLGRMEPVYGLVVLGSPIYNQYVTSFKAYHSSDGDNWHEMTGRDRKPVLFRGSTDSVTPVEVMLAVPVEARYVRINPRSWHDDIALRFDLIGCSDIVTTASTDITTTSPTTLRTAEEEEEGTHPSTTITTSDEGMMCDQPMGVDNGALADSQASVSSVLPARARQPMHGLRLSGAEAWRPITNTPNEWVKFDFGAPRQLTGVRTAGGRTGWVAAYQVDYSHDDHNWNPVTDDYGKQLVYPGNFDQNTPAVNSFKKPIRAQYLRVQPKKWTNNIEMRVEPLGCFEPYPTEPPTTEGTVASGTQEPTTPAPAADCNHCPGVPAVAPVEPGAPPCRCAAALWWDGERCTSRAQCPCVEHEAAYPVGHLFERADCSECLCALGGVAQCRPKQCEPCGGEGGLQAVVTATCGCTCKPCPPAQRLCPTSNICINVTAWCDGVVDCPDDEVNCVTTLTYPVTTYTIEPLITSTRASKQQCPPVRCPPRYRVQLRPTPPPGGNADQSEKLSPMFHMYGGRKMNRPPPPKENIAKYGTKKTKSSDNYRGAKVLPRKPPGSKSPSPSAGKQRAQVCVEFTCVPEDRLTKCPEPQCPPGYTVVYAAAAGRTEADDMSASKCQAYECQPPPLLDYVCNVTGRTFNTFDGTEFRYDICNHVLARDLHNEDWDISLVKNCTGGACSRNLLVRHGSQLLKLFPDLSIEYNGYRYTAEQTSLIGAKYLSFSLSKLGDTLVFVSNHFGFWIFWDKQGNVRIGVVEKLTGQVDGLCGYYDNNPADDKRKPDGALARTVQSFGDAWALGDQSVCAATARACPLHVQNRANRMCRAVHERVLAPCRGAVGDVDAWVSRCLDTACTCIEQQQVGGDDSSSSTDGDNDESTVTSREDQDNVCRCELLEKFVVECTTAKPSVQLEDWRMQLECPASCPAPLVHQDCFHRRCEPSCANLAEPDACPTIPNLCFPGCFCPPGLVRKKQQCVPPRECRDCECNVMPYLEYVTFDHANHTANTNCTYLMARDRSSTASSGGEEKHDFEVYVDNGPCRDNPAQLCTASLVLLYDGHQVHVQRGAEPDDELQVTVDDQPLPPMPYRGDWLQVTRAPATRHVTVLVPRIQLELRAYYPTLGASLRVPSHTYGKRMEGLCGDCNRNPDDDHMGTDGRPVTDEAAFVDGWRVENDGCFQEEATQCKEVAGPGGQDPCLVLLDAERFGQCHLLLDPAIFMSTCRHDTCGGRAELACASLATYARGCRGQGLCVDHHTPLCKARTCPAGTEYQLCGPPCVPTCAQPHCAPSAGPASPGEGCFCPEGLVLKNGTKCVEERECHVCDQEGHYAGDTWAPDPCTQCTCDNVTRSVSCEKQQCGQVDTVCPDGFQALKVQRPETECCEKYACVPVGTRPPDCADPKPLPCAPDQARKLEKRADGCHHYICQCIPLEECDAVADPTSEPLPAGMEATLDKSGCCPTVQLVCHKDRCPPPPPCPKHHQAKEVPQPHAPDTCCPEYKCVPPADKCVYTHRYTAAEKGGARERGPNEQNTVLLARNETLQDGPCTSCVCVAESQGDAPAPAMHTTCTATKCPPLSAAVDGRDYVVREAGVVDECCPRVQRTACKDRAGRVHQQGDKWHDDPLDACTETICVREPDEAEAGPGLGGVLRKHTNVMTCDKSCPLGARYAPAPHDSDTCCGACEVVACVFEGAVKQPGDKWDANGNCNHYKCVQTDDGLMMTSSLDTCAILPPPNTGDWEYRAWRVPGECCERHERVACLVNGTKYAVGAAWPDPGGDPCVSVTCVRTEEGAAPADIAHQRTVQTCNKHCKPGWEYTPPAPSDHAQPQCCGECVQMACVVNDTQHAPGDMWTSDDECTTYECERQSDGTLSTAVNQEICPDVSGCAPENLVLDGCCTKCNLTSLPSVKLCEVVKMFPKDTVGLIQQVKSNHGRCRNVQEIASFTECLGQCESGTMFNPGTSVHETKCSCCQALEYTQVPVELVCEDEYTFKKHVSMPAACSCTACAAAEQHATKHRAATKA